MDEVEFQTMEKVQISLNSLVSLITPRTMKLKGEILGNEVIVLVDCVATHNFISLELVNRLGIPLTEPTKFGVETGTGESVQGQGLCKDVVLILQELTIVETFLPLELGSTDVVLGMQWLGHVGRIEVDWHKLEMTINMGRSTVILKGDPSLRRTEVSLKAMCKTLKNGCPGVLVEFWGIAAGELEVEKDLIVPEEVCQILERHKEAFELPKGLPPQRSTDHAIILKDGINPINIRP